MEAEQTSEPEQLRNTAPDVCHMGQFSVAATEYIARQREEWLAAIVELGQSSKPNFQEIFLFAQTIPNEHLEWAIEQFLEHHLAIHGLFEGRSGLALSNEVAKKLVRSLNYAVVFGRLDLYQDSLDVELFYEMVRCHPLMLNGQIGKFKQDIDYSYTMELLLKHQPGRTIIQVVGEGMLPGIDVTEIAHQLIARDMLSDELYESFLNLNFEPARIATALAIHNHPKALTLLLGKYKLALDENVIVRVYQNIESFQHKNDNTGSGNEVLEAESAYMQRVTQCVDVLLRHTCLEQSSEAQRIAFVYQRLRNLLGNHVDGLCLQEAMELYSGQLPPGVQLMGVTQTGPAGLVQLEACAARFPAYFHNNRLLLALIRDSPIGRKLFQRHVNFISSGTKNATQTLFYDRLAAYEDEASEPMDSRYAPSRIYDIPLESGGKLRLAPDAIERYGHLLDAVELALNVVIMESPQMLSVWVHNLVHQVIYELGDLERAAALPSNASSRAQQKISHRRQQLADLNLRSVAEFEQNFLALVINKSLREDLLAAMLTVAFLRQEKRVQGWQNSLYVEVGQRLPRYPNVTAAARLCQIVEDAITYFDSSFVTAEARKALRVLASTEAIRTDLRKMQGEQWPSVGVRFEPTRGLLMQYSDFIAQTCWLDNTSHFAESHPGITTVMIRQKPGEQRDSIVGAFLFIEATTAEGEKLLVVRSVNPRETWINEVQVMPFYEALTDYIRTQAAMLERTPAICIGGKVREFATNRRKMHTMLSNPYLLDDIFNIIKTDDVNFNGYGNSVLKSTYRL